MLPSKELTAKEKRFFNKIWANTIGKIVVISISSIIVLILLLFLAALLFANPLLNGTVKDKLISSIESNPAFKVKAGNISFHPFSNGISISNIDLVKVDSMTSMQELHIRNSYGEINGINWFRVILGKGISLNGIKLQNPFVQINKIKFINNNQPDSSNKDTKIQNKDLRELIFSAIPKRLLPLRIDQLEVDSGRFIYKEQLGKSKPLITLDSINRITFKISKVSIDPEEKKRLNFAEDLNLELKNFFHRFSENKYELNFDSLFISTKDSILYLNNFEYKSYLSDSLFFEGKEFKSNLYKTKAGKIKMEGVNFPLVTKDSTLSIKKILIDGFQLDITENKKLPDNPQKTIPQMPNQAVKSINEKFKIDSINLRNGVIKYAELFPYSIYPAILPFTNVNAVIKNISNYREKDTNKTMQLNVSANLADAGKLSINMDMDLKSRELLFNYKGRLDSMDMTRLNSFLKLDAGVIVKSCKVKSVAYTVNVINGIANGSVKPVYDNLKIEILNKEKSKQNILTKVMSLFARKVKIHESNPQDGELRTGKVSRKHSDDEPFLHFVWVSIREGLGDAVGF